jgi:hypothetical protein
MQQQHFQQQQQQFPQVFFQPKPPHLSTLNLVLLDH